MAPSPRASPLALLLLLLALPRAAAQGPCAPGSSLSGGATCVPCAGATYSFGGAASGCAPCSASGAASQQQQFVSASAGCSPAAANASAQGLALWLSGASDEGTAAFGRSGAPVGAAASFMGAAGGALSLQPSTLLTTPQLPQLPTGNAARTLSAWVKCDAPPGGAAARSVLSLYDPTNAQGERFSVLATGAAGGAMSAPAQSPVYSVSTICGNSTGAAVNGPLGTSMAFKPIGVAVDASSGQPGSANVYFVDQQTNDVRGITQPGLVTFAIAGSPTGAPGFADGVGSAALFSAPQCIALDPTFGLLYVADTSNRRIRVVNLATANVTTLAGSATSGKADGQGTAATFNAPAGVAVSANGQNVYVADYGNFLVRMINASGFVSTLAGTGATGSADGVGTNAAFTGIRGLALNPANTVLYIGDYNNHKIRALNLSSLSVSTYVGVSSGAGTAGFVDGFGTSVKMNVPYGLSADGAGTLYVSDNSNGRIRKIFPASQGQPPLAITIAGSGAGAAVDGLGSAAKFNAPFGSAVDQFGNVYTAEFNNHRVRKISAPTVTSTTATFPVCDSATWRHIAVTLSASGAATLYIDGAPANTTAAAVNTATWQAAALSIGGNAFESLGYSGFLSDVGVYSRALNATEVLWLSRPPLLPSANATISPNPLTAPLGTTSFTYSCSLGFIGAPLVVSRSADGSWSSTGGVGGGRIACVTCLASQFSLPGGTACINPPTLPTFANAVVSPPAAALSVLSYVYTCAQPGSGGATQNLTYDAASNTFVWTGSVACVACSAAQFSLPTASGFACRACADYDANLQLLPNGSSSVNGLPVPCGCAPNFYSNGASTVAALWCTACPAGSTAAGSPTTCTCNAGFTTFYSGSALQCICNSPNLVLGSGASASCVAPSSTPTPSSSPSVSSTPTPTVTASPTPSATPPASVSATPSSSPTPSQTRTPSNTATPSITPSATPVPDVLVLWALSFPVAGVGLSVVSSPAVLAAMRVAYSSLLGVPQASIYIANATDLASGAMAAQSAIARSRRRRRQLQAPGSAGVSVQLAADLGKTPVVATAQAMVAALSAPPPAGFFAGILASVSAASGVPLSRLSASPGPALLFYSQIAGLSGASGAGLSSSSASGSGSSTAGAAVGGVLAAIALALCVWTYRSWAKHGKLPCCRDRAHEAFLRKSQAVALDELKYVNPVVATSSRGLKLRVPKEIADELEALRAQARARTQAGRAEDPSQESMSGRQAFLPASRV